MADTTCRWGFLSTAGIARKNWKAIRLSGNGTVSAVASRSQNAADRFIDECMQEVPMSSGRPAAVEGYEALLQRDDVDAVYIPLPTSMRLEWVLKAAAAGKHVLCEKPIAGTLSDAQQMVDACRSHGVQFMDGVMFSHSRRLDAMKPDLAKFCGNLRRITTQFTFNGGEEFNRENIRTDSRLEPHGCLGDLGWYTIRMILWAMDFQLPESVTARTLRQLQGSASPAGVPGEFSAELFFAGGVTASFYNSFVTEHSQLVTLSGDAGYISLDDFVLPSYSSERVWTGHQNYLEIDNCRWNMQARPTRRSVNEYPGGEPNAQEVNMVRTFGDIVGSGQLDPFWPEIAIKNQTVLNACRESADNDGARVTL
ncbi:Gfo/Idh/MocA family protein [Roseimaritima ulvae]|uniref:1,5-anhydro-D-fructose reductase n=1 Tax=Roseimaritima ulvae TaxID=980254 RepID=A0A5B9QQ37_9BACT|nr:Gfo/Idh/MocA family oxidoreductase [Roseimaritima ulvae]QEG40022.1 1,5-anhydro-D-fructose reductase [Roseimaritima ulvae]